MRHTYPEYYHEFSCIADQCPCTCCAGWAIEIDDASIECYRKKNIQTVDYKEEIFLQDGTQAKRCMNLTENGLCRLMIEHGEEILCDTCRLFPRHTEEFKDVRDHSLSISCPEAARMILSTDQPIRFDVSEDKEEDREEYDEYEQEIFLLLDELRWKMIDTLQDPQMSLVQKCRKILDEATILQNEIDEKTLQNEIDEDAGVERLFPEGDASSAEEIFDAMLQWEYTSDDFPEMLERYRKILFESDMTYDDPIMFLKNPVIEMKLQQIVVYFVYAYFCGSTYDEYYYGMAQLAVCAAIHISMLCEARRIESGGLTESEVVRFTYLYTRELEHSIPNMLAVESWMDDHRI